MTIALPTVEHHQLFHVGDLDGTAAGRNSLEGYALSVSRHPDEWAEIARLGGRPTHQLVAPDGRGLFCDAHALTASARLQLTTWATRTRWVDPVRMYRVTRDDDELGATYTLLIADPGEALDEADGDSDAITAIDTVTATRHLLERCRWTTRAHGDCALELALICFVDDEAPHLDGVWFDETLDVAALSAPRGALLPRAVATWARS